jgi:hypothetical protein
LPLPATVADLSAVAREKAYERLALTGVDAAMSCPLRGFFAGVSKTF